MPLPPHKNIGVVDVSWVKLWATGKTPFESNWDETAREIDDLRAYHRDYTPDMADYADPVNPECIVAAVALLAHLKLSGFPAPWCVYPVSGGVNIEWDFDSHWDGTRWAKRGSHMSVLFMGSRPWQAEGMFTSPERDEPTVFADIAF